MDELQRRMTMTGIAATRDSLVAMSEEHRIIRQEVECTGEELQRDSRAYMTMVTGLAQTDCTKVEGFLGRMSERIVQLKAMWQERQRQLEVTREGYDYKDKVQEVLNCNVKDRQTDRQMDGLTDGQTGRQTDRQTDEGTRWTICHFCLLSHRRSSGFIEQLGISLVPIVSLAMISTQHNRNFENTKSLKKNQRHQWPQQDLITVSKNCCVFPR